MFSAAKIMQSQAVGHLPYRSRFSFCIRGGGNHTAEGGWLATRATPDSASDNGVRTGWVPTVRERCFLTHNGVTWLLRDVRETEYKRLVLTPDRTFTIRPVHAQVLSGLLYTCLSPAALIPGLFAQCGKMSKFITRTSLSPNIQSCHG